MKFIKRWLVVLLTVWMGVTGALAQTDLSGTYRLKYQNGKYLTFAEWTSASMVSDEADATVFSVTKGESYYSIRATVDGQEGFLSPNSRLIRITSAGTEYRWSFTPGESDGYGVSGYIIKDEVVGGSFKYLYWENATRQVGSMSGFIWQLVPVSNQATYQVVITGAPEGTTVKVKGENYANGDTFGAASGSITQSDVVPAELEGYTYTVTVEDDRITVAYSSTSTYTETPLTISGKYVRLGISGVTGCLANSVVVDATGEIDWLYDYYCDLVTIKPVSNTDWSTLWTVEQVSGKANTYRLVPTNAAKYGLYLGSPYMDDMLYVSMSGAEMQFVQASTGENYLKMGAKYVVCEEGQLGLSDTRVEGQSWTVTPVTEMQFQMPAGYRYATFCPPVDCCCSSSDFKDMCGYTLEEYLTTDATVYLDIYSTSKFFEANHGHIVVSKTAGETYTLKLDQRSGFSGTYDYNLLTGVTCMQSGFSSGQYFGVKNITEDGLNKAVLAVANTTVVPANKAVYVPESGIGTRQYVLRLGGADEGITTGIREALGLPLEHSQGYDLCGRKVSQAAKGQLIISQGRKILK